MLSQLYLDLAAMRYGDILKEAERERRANEALSISRARALGRAQSWHRLAWLSRWSPRAIWRGAAARG